MKRELSVQTTQRAEFVNITASVQSAAAELGVCNGVLTVCVPHTTAGVTINENADPDVMSDLKKALDRIVPWDGRYDHGEGNAAAHVKASLMGSSVRVPVENGRIQLGAWQGIFFCEFDGPRNRLVRVFDA